MPGYSELTLGSRPEEWPEPSPRELDIEFEHIVEMKTQKKDNNEKRRPVHNGREHTG